MPSEWYSTLTTIAVGIIASLPGLLAYRNQRRVVSADVNEKEAGVAEKYEALASRQTDQIDALKKRVTVLESSAKRRESEIERLNSEIVRLGKKVIDLQAANAQLTDELGNAQKIIERLNMELLQERVTNQVQIDDLKNRIDEMESENHRLAKKEEELEILRRQYNALRGGGIIPPLKDGSE